MIEVGTIDHGHLVAMNGDVAADTAPKSHTFQGYHENVFAINLARIVLLAVNLAFVFHYLGILGLGLCTIKVTNVQRIEYLLLNVECHVGILHGLQCLEHESQQEGHDDDKYRAIYYNVRVVVSIQFHLEPPLFIRFEILRSTTKWSMVGANMFISRMASIIPSG